MFELLRKAFGGKDREQPRAPERADAGSQAAPPKPALRELGVLPPPGPAALADGSGPEPTAGVVGTLRARKLAGMRDRANRLAQERQREAEAEARTAAERQDRESKQMERDRLLAQRTFQALADLIEQSAARGLDGREYPWGNCFDARRCVCSVSPAKARSTAPVGSLPAGESPNGCLDMAGNVSEWLADWYDHNCRSTRGGAWHGYDADNFRAYYRFRREPHSSSSILEFRCVSPEGSS